MREILFRGKQKSNGDWVHGDLSYHKDGRVFIRCWDRLGFDPAYNAYEVNPETVGQFTGLTDKNGKKAFEGDIFVTKCNKGVIAFDDDYGTFGFQIWWKGFPDDFATFKDFGKPVFEIIGNIYDNPELLEEA